MLKKITYFLPIIFMCILIFLFSADSGKSSEGKSRQLIKASVISVNVVAYKWGIIEEIPTHEEVDNLVFTFEYPVRKLAHISIFFILATIIMFILCGKTKLKFWKICLICLGFCLIVAFFDEFHQTFVDGRSGEFLDVLIDVFGSLLAILLYDLFRYVNNALNG